MSTASNESIAAAMRATAQAAAQPGAALAATETPPCGAGFTVANFAVTYPNDELIAGAMVTGVPSGTKLVGITAAACPAAADGTTYCMGVASDSAGLTLPAYILGASTSPSFPAPTTVTGILVLAYYASGSSDMQQCTLSRQFTVGS